MEQSQQVKTVLILIAVLLVVGLGFFFIGSGHTSKGTTPQTPGGNENRGPSVVVESTPIIDGVMSAPAGFPSDIPLETGAILESVTTRYPIQKAKQFSLSYRSVKTIAQKYNEYKDYIRQAGYQITEGDSNASVKAIFGTKSAENLSAVFSSLEGKTLVQLSYFFKSN